MAKQKNPSSPKDFSEREETIPPVVTSASVSPDNTVLTVHTTVPLLSENTNGVEQPKRSKLPIAIRDIDPTNIGLALWRIRLLLMMAEEQLGFILQDKLHAGLLKKAAAEEKCQLLSTIEKWEPFKKLRGVMDRIPVPPGAVIDPPTGLDEGDTV